jgi:hypothetical protein
MQSNDISKDKRSHATLANGVPIMTVPTNCTTDVFDLSGFNRLDSRYIDTLLKAARQAPVQDARPVVIVDHPAVLLALRVLRLDTVFTVCTPDEFELAHTKVSSFRRRSLDTALPDKKARWRLLPVLGLVAAGLSMSSCKAGIFTEPRPQVGPYTLSESISLQEK